MQGCDRSEGAGQTLHRGTLERETHLFHLAVREKHHTREGPVHRSSPTRSRAVRRESKQLVEPLLQAAPQEAEIFLRAAGSGRTDANGALGVFAPLLPCRTPADECQCEPRRRQQRSQGPFLAVFGLTLESSTQGSPESCLTASP